jgi:two-component system cell cycle sensor histidine kinase/response regulator CckA
MYTRAVTASQSQLHTPDGGPNARAATLAPFVARGLALIVAVFGVCLLAEHLWFADAPPQARHYLHLVRGVVTSLFVMFWGTLSVRQHLREKRCLQERQEAAAQIAFQASLLEQVRNAVIAVDPDGRIIFWNRFAEQLYQWPAREVLGRNILDVTVHPGDVAGARAVMEEVARSGSWEGECVARRKDGTAIATHLVNAALFDGTGRPSGIVGVSVDITERRRTKERQATQFAVTRVLADATTAAAATTRLLQAICEGLGWDLGELWAVDEAGGLLRWQDFWQVVALSADEFTAASRSLTFAPSIGLPGRVWSSGQPAWIGEVAEDANFLRGALTARAGLHSAFAFPVRNGATVTGVIAFFSRTVRPFDEDKLRMMADIGSQIGQFLERRRAEEALRDSETRYRLLAENAEDLISRHTPAGVFLYVSPACRSLLGYEPEDLIGRRAADLIHPESLEGGHPWLAADLAQPEPPLVSSRLQRKDGTFVWVETSMRVLNNPATGSAPEIVCVTRNRTERKRLEDQFRQVQKMEAVGRLAGGMAHDFNNMLTVILCNSGLLLSKLGVGAPGRAFVEEIRKASERAAALTRQLLAFSRKQVSAPQTVDLNAAIVDMKNMLLRLIGEDIELGTVLDPSLGCVKVDPGQLGQVLMNLAVNARDAMPQGGKVTVTTANVEVSRDHLKEYLGVPPGRYVQVTMTDTGCGMTPEVQAHLFEPFFTTKEEGRGTGLGLSTVYGIIKQSGGHIECRSELGRGTTFQFLLPRTQTAQEVSEPGVNSAEAPRGTETVLLVEDDDTVRILTRQILQHFGYSVLEAKNGVEALQVSERHSGPIHVLVTDVIMPQMNGHDLASRLTALRPGLRVLIMSGYAEEANGHRSESGEAVAILYKPLTPTTLAQAVRQVLDNNHATRPSCGCAAAEPVGVRDLTAAF